MARLRPMTIGPALAAIARNPKLEAPDVMVRVGDLACSNRLDGLAEGARELSRGHGDACSRKRNFLRFQELETDEVR
jgi:hypothetical protein